MTFCLRLEYIRKTSFIQSADGLHTENKVMEHRETTNSEGKRRFLHQSLVKRMLYTELCRADGQE